ncbi:MAG TPA: SPOR domain-containing protein [Longimicrobiales bacterium]|nr:SPOR domain-containing protein [Longimicrobiales bacterium]
MRPRPTALAAAALVAAALAVPLPGPLGPRLAAAQVPTLDRVDSLVAAGRYDDARATLDRWWSAREAFQVPGSDRVRAMMLRARLQTDPAAAENDYLGIIIGHPTSPYAPEALLRLGQGLLATGQAARSAAYLHRLTTDYPGRPQRPVALLWLARAETAARHPAAACRAAREGLLDAAGDPDLAAMLRVEETAACRMAAAAGPDPVTEETRADTPRPAVPTPAPARDRPDPETGAYAVQTGAFRYRAGADALMARLRDAGYEPRAVTVPANDLLRIRVGRFATARDAARVVERLKRAGFDALVVRDAAEERSP